MPKYTSNAYLTKDGKVYRPGKEIELTKEQAERLGDKVKDEGEGEGEGEFSENDFRNLPAQEQKDLVESKGGDLEELTNEDKRTEFFMSN